MLIINKTIPYAELLLVGEGHCKNRLKLLTRALRIQDKVKFIPESNTSPRIPDEKLPLYYNAADVFVLPSLLE